MRVQLIGGAYVARSPIANAQSCVNLYVENNPEGAPTKTTHYQRAAKIPVAVPPVPGLGRGVFRASNGVGYGVVGQAVYKLTVGIGIISLKHLGDLAVVRSNPCKMTDNGLVIFLVDGSSAGYTIDLNTDVMTQIVDGTGSFTGSTHVDYIDTFMIYNYPDTKNFGSTLSNVLTFDPLYIAGKTAYPDPLMALIVNRHEILLIGQLKTEAWYDAGSATFPFAELPGAYFEHGTIAKYSPASLDISVFMLSQDLQGTGTVTRIKGYETKKISNHAVDYAIRLMKNSVGISDAIGLTRQQDGHLFYELHFPAGDLTLVYDDATSEWYQSAWTDPVTGTLHRDRSPFYANLSGLDIGQDWEFGTFYILDPLNYIDVVVGEIPTSTSPITFQRTFPHIMAGEINLGQPGMNKEILSDGNQVIYSKFVADCTTGTGPEGAEFTLAYSIDRGNTFDTVLLAPAGNPGEFSTPPLWRALGTARDTVFRLQWNFAGEVALNGAWIDARVGIS